MKNKIILTLLLVTVFLKITSAQEPVKKTLSEGKKYTFENCINRLNVDQAVKTQAGYQYWFIGQKFLEDGLTVKMSVVAPGQSTHAPHRHAEDEIFFILEGTAQFYLDGKTTTAGPFTSFYCPSNIEHGISNAGVTELKYLVIKKYNEK